MNKDRHTQRRLLLIILLPCLICAVLLSGYFSIQHQSLLEQQNTKQAILLSRQLALHAARLMEGDGSRILPESFTEQRIRNLRGSLQSYLDLPELRSMALLNSAQAPIIQLGPNMLPPTTKRFIEQQVHRFDTANSIRVRAPIFARHDKLKETILGWLELEFNTSFTRIAQYQALLSSLLLALGVCLFGFYMAYKASNRITRPLQHITATLEQLESGNLEARIQLSEQEEFSQLATGINSMAASLHRAQQELQDNIEQATQDLKETLEEMEVQNIELNLARRSALESSNTKSEFLANMSHEIRTPLNGILGFSKLLEKTRLNKRQQEYLHTIESSSSGLLSIINDILDFSKIEAGKLVLDSAPVHIRDVADEVLAMLAPEAHKRDLELVALVYQDVPTEIMADATRLKQVLTNLVSNAIKFTESGSVIVRIMLEEHIKQKVALKITITDTGIGLTSDQQKNLFKAFSQADTSTTRRYGGTGLGLVISSYLVEHMQGEIGFTSQYGAGSQFWFTGQFDVCTADMESWGDAPWYQQCAYLLCHWEVTRQALQHQLSNLGFKVKVFNTLDELLTAQHEQVASLCLIELNEQDHHDSIQILKRDSDVLALLPNNESHYLSLLQKYNLEHNLVYPVSFRRLTQHVHDLLGETTQDQRNFTTTPLTVLAVDDNEPNLQLLTTWLQDLNVTVKQAQGGLEAVKLGCSEKFDLIFMDIQMPDLNGVLATKQIRQHTLNSHTPLVALTAHALPNERKHLLQSGFDDYLTKPISEEQLVHTLMKWTHYQRAGQSTYIKKNSVQNDVQEKNTSSSADASLVVDWERCLKLAGGKSQLAKAMLSGLIDEVKTLHELVKNKEPEHLMEPVHKTHGLCKYVGAENLQLALEEAETCLKTDCGRWPNYQQQLLHAIEQLINWDKDSQWLERLNELALD